MEEEWRQIEDYPDYKISESGVVLNIVKNKIISQIWNGGYLCVNLTNKNTNKRRLEKVHREVAKAFVTKPEPNCYFVLHKDDDRKNNHWSNLLWEISRLHGVGYNLPRGEELFSKCSVVWNGMISRCYYERNPWYYNYGRVGCCVHDDWHDYYKFREWYCKRISLFVENKFIELDKDILGDGKMYKEEFCCLVPRKINNMFKINSKYGVEDFKENMVWWKSQIYPGDYDNILNEGIKKLILREIKY